MANTKECEKVGLDPKKVESLARRFEKLCREAKSLGISVFFGSGCSLRYNDGGDGDLIVARISASNADGGAGDISEDDDGYERGESA